MFDHEFRKIRRCSNYIIHIYVCSRGRNTDGRIDITNLADSFPCEISGSHGGEYEDFFFWVTENTDYRSA
jgi:hypothetical protein